MAPSKYLDCESKHPMFSRKWWKRCCCCWFSWWGWRRWLMSSWGRRRRWRRRRLWCWWWWRRRRRRRCFPLFVTDAYVVCSPRRICSIKNCWNLWRRILILCCELRDPEVTLYHSCGHADYLDNDDDDDDDDVCVDNDDDDDEECWNDDDDDDDDDVKVRNSECGILRDLVFVRSIWWDQVCSSDLKTINKMSYYFIHLSSADHIYLMRF